MCLYRFLQSPFTVNNCIVAYISPTMSNYRYLICNGGIIHIFNNPSAGRQTIKILKKWTSTH